MIHGQLAALMSGQEWRAVYFTVGTNSSFVQEDFARVLQFLLWPVLKLGAAILLRSAKCRLGVKPAICYITGLVKTA